MHKITKLHHLLILFLALIILPFYAYTGEGKHIDYVKGDILIKFKHSAKTNVKANIHKAMNLRVVKEFKKLGWQHVKLPEDADMQEAIKKLRASPYVEHIEPNYIRKVCATPNDTYFYNQWGLTKILADTAWDRATGFEGIIVAVVDTGVAYEHPDLSENIWRNYRETAGNGIDDDGNGYIDDIYGWNFRDNNNDPSDYDGHGTHVAGIIGGMGNNSSGIAGLNWKVRIMPLKVSDASGYMYTSDIVNAITYAVDNGAKIINASYGGYNYSQFEYDAISYANSKGVLFVAAAGNESINNDTFPHYPSSYGLPNIISVAATDEYDQLASFSNYGPTSVHVAAPGTSIFSTVAGRKTIFEDEFNSLSLWNTSCSLKTGDACSYAPAVVNGHWEDSPYANYDNNSVAYVETKDAINATGEKGVSLAVSGNIDTEQDYDFMRLKINSSVLEETSGRQSIYKTYDISSYSASPFKIRFELETDEDYNYDGIKLDYIKVASYRAAEISDIEYKQGTSMATPHVAGLAALLLSLNPDLSVSQLKSTILSNVDALSSLSSKVSTGGRINAYKAVSAVDCNSPFSDISCNNWALNYIREIKKRSITTGCGSGNYCPNIEVTRGQMAAFIIRAKYGETFSYTQTPYFSDVPSNHWAFKYVQKLKDERITNVSGVYGVDNYVTREQMAAFIIRAKYGESFTYTQTPCFSDVSLDSWAFKYVQKLKDERITNVSGNYMAGSIVTRDQMSAFLWRAFIR